MADVCGKIGSISQVVTDHVHRLGGCLAVDAKGWLSCRAWVHRVVDRVHVHARVQFVIDLVLIALSLEHIQALVLCVTHDQRIVAPHAVVGVSVILHDLVNIATGLVDIGTGDAANADAQLVVGDISARAVVHKAVEIVTSKTLVTNIAVVALVGQQVIGMLTHELAIVE